MVTGRSDSSRIARVRWTIEADSKAILNTMARITGVTRGLPTNAANCGAAIHVAEQMTPADVMLR